MGSGMEHPIGSKVAKTSATMKDVNVDIDPDGDVASMKVSNGLWMLVVNDVKKGTEHVAAALEEKNSLL